MSKIVSIATAVPSHKYEQAQLFAFAEKVYSKDESESRKLKFLYNHSGIESRYSVLPDFNAAAGSKQFFPPGDDLEPFPSIEKRMNWFNNHAASLSAEAISECINGRIHTSSITHLITVTCTGLSAPGLDLQVMELLGLNQQIIRTSVNFMGCYAAVHALKIGDAFCKADKNANVIIVCTELCTLHFQKKISQDNITSSLLFGDGSAAVLMQEGNDKKGISINSFYSDVSFKGKNEMAWELSTSGFLMTLTGYIPDLIREDFAMLTDKALMSAALKRSDITHWCIHPGGKKILEAIIKSLDISPDSLDCSYEVLKEYGNMSSPTILFVLKKMMDGFDTSVKIENPVIFGAAFGPGLTMETFIATYG